MKKYIIYQIFACLLAALALFSGCENKTVQPAHPAINLETAVWQLTEFLVCPEPVQVPDTLSVPITIKFSAGKIEGFGGCNGYGGNYLNDGRKLIVEGVIRTEMYCEGVSDWENSYLEILQNSQSYTIREEVLEISSGDMGGLKFRLNWKKR